METNQPMSAGKLMQFITPMIADAKKLDNRLVQAESVDEKTGKSLSKARASLQPALNELTNLLDEFYAMGARSETEKETLEFKRDGEALRRKAQGALPRLESELESVRQHLHNAETQARSTATQQSAPSPEAQATVVTPEPAHTEPELTDEDAADPDVDVDALSDEPVEADEQPLPGVARQLAAFAGVDTESLSDEEIGTLTLADCDAAFHELSEKDQRNRTAALSANGRFIKNRPAAAAQQSKPVAPSSSVTEPGEWKQKASALFSKLKGPKKKHHNNRGTAL